MPINERGEFVRERSVEEEAGSSQSSVPTRPASPPFEPPRRSSPSSGRGFAIFAFIALLITCGLVYRKLVSGNENHQIPEQQTDRFEGKSLGVPSGITWVHAIGDRGALFSAANSSRIEYPNMIPSEGTIEFWINVKDGYHYDNYQFLPNQSDAMIFSSDAQGGDVTWPGTTKIFVSRDGEISLWMATSKYNKPAAVATEALDTSFGFGRWHAIGFSYGSKGQYIMLDGKVVASAPDRTQTFGVAGNHDQRLDIPTIGETVSHFWARHQYSGGFEGTLAAFRISRKQEDWQLAKGVKGIAQLGGGTAAPVRGEDRRERDLVGQAQQLFAAGEYEEALSTCNEALTINASDGVAITLKHDIKAALRSSNKQRLANLTSQDSKSFSALPPAGNSVLPPESRSDSNTSSNLANEARGTLTERTLNAAPTRLPGDHAALNLLSLVQSAMGGEKRLAAIRDWQRQSIQMWFPSRGTTRQTVFFAAPSTLRIETFGGNKVVDFSNGQSGWTWSSTTGPASALPTPTATGMVFRQIPELVLSDEEPGRAVRLLNPSTLEISDENHDDVKLTINLTTHLPEKIAWTSLDGAALEEVYSDWRPDNGILWWFRMTRLRNGVLFLRNQVLQYRVNTDISSRALNNPPDTIRQRSFTDSITPRGHPLIIHTDADRRGTLLLFNDHLVYRDDGMGTNGGRAPYGPNPANDFSLSCSEIEGMRSYGFRVIVFGSFQVVITARRKHFHIPTLHGHSVAKAIREECGISK